MSRYNYTNPLFHRIGRRYLNFRVVCMHHFEDSSTSPSIALAVLFGDNYRMFTEPYISRSAKSRRDCMRQLYARANSYMDAQIRLYGRD